MGFRCPSPDTSFRVWALLAGRAHIFVDNLTHSLAGLVVADAAIQLRAHLHPSKAAPPGFREAALATAVLASNLPDLDFLYAGITRGKLGYLLHHRGHTHTLLAVLPLSLVCVLVVMLALRLRGLRLPASEHKSLLGLAAGSGGLHLLMDYGNNYGVHPFWPQTTTGTTATRSSSSSRGF
jgi:inner membrane protein